MQHPKLTIEIIPFSTGGDNLRYALARTEWQRLRDRIVAAASYRCEVCGSNPKQLECHEVWALNETTSTQRLVGLTSLCRLCHLVKHMGRAGWIVNYDDAFDHMCRVNGWTTPEGAVYAEQQKRETWRISLDHGRVPRGWNVDMSYIQQLGFTPLPLFSLDHLGMFEAKVGLIPQAARCVFKASRRRTTTVFYDTRRSRTFHVGYVEGDVETRAQERRLLASLPMRLTHDGTFVGNFTRLATEAKIVDQLTRFLQSRRTTKPAQEPPG